MYESCSKVETPMSTGIKETTVMAIEPTLIFGKGLSQTLSKAIVKAPVRQSHRAGGRCMNWGK